MAKMTWNDEIAGVAQELSDTCVFQHDFEQRCDGKSVGQNIYWSSVQSLNEDTLLDSMKKWHDEIDYFDFEKNSCEKGEVCGHYTQMIWSTNYQVGCGATVCLGYGVIVACNFYPGGNVGTALPFEKASTPCADCTSIFTRKVSSGTKCEDKLCALVTESCVDANIKIKNCIAFSDLCKGESNLPFMTENCAKTCDLC
ncbi:hypothetical protein CAPTEDRAFT_228205 [Capitella teleta]|uniref:ShKT domain-containing protein n=1 Tax=Capitella teleta TaxID=283909 RepID=R7UB13_CAPTE|nr:hypothetical protein CAPTEDRAFT_228205 [Capitella teleta]|eukprot:ELU00978.1 hypothetical protein CAPTEDRAFT_228205 [Capitella teleta]